MLNRRQFLSTLLAVTLGWRFRASSRVEAFLAQMDLRQKVGQIFLFSLPGITFDDSMRRLVADYHAGGMVFFTYNIGTPETLTDLTNSFQRTALQEGMPIPLLLAVDQEGGRVSRMQGDGYASFPNPMNLGAANDPELTFAIAEAIGVEMDACGLNMNLAPVLDVNSYPANPVINVRAFGGDPEITAQQGAAFIRGLHSAGIIATGKHFPGHGSTLTDSHYDLPIVTLDRESLLREMQPFIQAIGEDIGAMMTAHVLYNGLDNTPATFSKPILTDLLRTELGYNGIIISDALTMGAVQAARDDPLFALRDALLAGVDMLAFGPAPGLAAPTITQQIDMLEMVVSLVENGLVDEARINDAARRVLALKERFGVLDWQPLESSTVRERMHVAAHQDLLRHVAEQSITLLSDPHSLLPLDPSMPLLVLYPQEFPLTGRAILAAAENALDMPYAVADAGRRIQAARNAAEGRTIVCFTLDTARYPGQVGLVNALPLDRTLVVAAQSPYDILNFPLVQTYLMTFDTTPQTLAALKAVLFGELQPKGTLPVALLDY
jgi:beta-N-acetylhexosaminidase